MTFGAFGTGPYEPRDHSFEELREASIEVLKQPSTPNQYSGLLEAVAGYFARREPSPQPSNRQVWIATYPSGPRLSDSDRDLMLEVFWDLFRCGVIILGLNGANPDFPWFRVSRYGSGEKIGKK